MLQRSWDAVSHRRVQRPCVRLGYHLKTPHQSLQMIRHHARLSGSANFRDAGYENLISSRPSSALNRKLHRRDVQGKEATSDLRTRLCLRNLQDEEQEPPQNTTNTGKSDFALHYLEVRTKLWHIFISGSKDEFPNIKTSTIFIVTLIKWLDRFETR